MFNLTELRQAKAKLEEKLAKPNPTWDDFKSLEGKTSAEREGLFCVAARKAGQERGKIHDALITLGHLIIVAESLDL